MEVNKTVTLDEIKNLIKATVSDELNGSLKSVKEELAKLNRSVSEQKPMEKGIYQTRILRAQIETLVKRAAGTAIKNNSVLDEVLEVLAKRYGDDVAFMGTVNERAKDLMATGNGGNLIVEDYATEFIDLLWNNTILDKVGVRFMPTSTGNLSMPKILEGIAAGYVGEGGTINTSTIKFGKIRLSVKKLMALVPISNDLLRYSSVNVDAILRDQLLKQMARVADWAVLYGAGGEYEPRGLVNTAGIQVEAATQTTVATRAMGLEMLKMLGKKNHSIDSGLYWIMGWDSYINLLEERDEFVGYRNPEVRSGTFLGHPFVVSNTVANDNTYEDLFLVKFDEFIGIQGMNVEIVPSTEATIPVSGGTLSAFAQDYTIVRAIVEHDFGMAYGHAVVYFKPLMVAGA